MREFRSKTLMQFLCFCDEDRSYAAFFSEATKSVLKIGGCIIDCGSGPGTKIGAVSWISDASRYLLTEEDLDWAPHLKVSATAAFRPIVQVEVRFGDFFASVSKDELEGADLVTMLQVPYGEEFAARFHSWAPEYAKFVRTFLASAESDCSPTAELRARITDELGIPTSRSCLTAVASDLSGLGFSTTLETLAGKTLLVTPSIVDGTHWLPDFLLGEDGRFLSLNADDQRRTLEIINEAVRDLGREWKLVDDLLIATRQVGA